MREPTVIPEHETERKFMPEPTMIPEHETEKFVLEPTVIPL